MTTNIRKQGIKQVSSRERECQAIELRKAGHTYQHIAEQLGWSNASGAEHAVKRALMRTIQEPADDLRTLECLRLDTLLSGVWQKAIGGNLQAIDRVLAILSRRAKLLGLDAPITFNLQQIVNETALNHGLSDLEKAELMASIETYLSSNKAAT